MGMYSFANARSEARKIKDIEVRFRGDGNHFMTSQNVNNLLIQSFPKTSNINKTNIDLNSLELILRSHELIRKADIYTTVDGKLKADVWQKRAIGRVVYDKDSYYIDSEGGQMPLSSIFSARVPIIEGDVNEKNGNRLATILKYIDEDNFLKKNITGIVIQKDQTLIMRSRDQDFKILFGSFEDARLKFENLKAFLNFISNDEELMKSYKTINLKFTQQVVCTK